MKIQENAIETRAESTTPLHRLRRGDVGVISHARCNDEEAGMLRAMGLRPRTRVRLARQGEPCIVQVIGEHGVLCRVGLARRLARSVRVGVLSSD